MGKYDRFVRNKELQEFDWGKIESRLKRTKRVPITNFDVIEMAMKETPYDRKLRMLRQLNNTCKACTMCSLGRRDVEDNIGLRDPHVFSNMNPTRFVVVGQNPGINEVREGTPFVGHSGDNFNIEIEANGLSRDDFYITNIVKCFTKDNAKPSLKNINRCKTFLMMELSLINPILVITLGAVSFNCLCPSTRYSDGLKNITKSEEFDVDVYGVYHPSPRNLGDRYKNSMFKKQIEVLCKLVNKLKEKS